MTDQDLTKNFFLKIQHAHGQKMIDPPSVIQICNFLLALGFI